jgi:hypothetical protein
MEGGVGAEGAPAEGLVDVAAMVLVCGEFNGENVVVLVAVGEEEDGEVVCMIR